MSKTYKQKLVEKLRASSSHGIPRIFETKNLVLKILWIIVFLSSFSYCLYTVIKSVIQYEKYEVTAQLEVTRESPTTFPTVTICNLNPFNFDYNINSKWIDQQLIELGLTYAVNFSIIDNPQLTDPNDPNVFSVLSDIYSRVKLISISRSDSWKRYLGYDLGQDMLLSCQFNKMDCQANDFYRIWSNDYGNCYMFNSGKDYLGRERPLHKTSEKGIDRGLQVEILVGDPSKEPRFSYRSGILVIIQNNTKSPLTLENAISVETGQETYLSVSRTFIQKLAKPYSNCLDEMRNFSSYSKKLFDYIDKYNLTKRYDRELCYKMCFQDRVLEKCSCFDTSFQRLNDVNNYCSYKSELECAKNVSDLFRKSDLDVFCDNSCPPECQRESYTVSSHTASYPTKYYFNQLLAAAKVSNYATGPLKTLSNAVKNLGNLSSFEMFDRIRNNIVKLTVNYNDLSYNVVQESPVMTFETLLGVIGGQMGLFIGISFLSLFEIIEIFIELLIIPFKKMKQKEETPQVKF